MEFNLCTLGRVYLDTQLISPNEFIHNLVSFSDRQKYVRLGPRLGIPSLETRPFASFGKDGVFRAIFLLHYYRS